MLLSPVDCGCPREEQKVLYKTVRLHLEETGIQHAKYTLDYFVTGSSGKNLVLGTVLEHSCYGEVTMVT